MKKKLVKNQTYLSYETRYISRPTPARRGPDGRGKGKLSAGQNDETHFASSLQMGFDHLSDPTLLVGSQPDWQTHRHRILNTTVFPLGLECISPNSIACRRLVQKLPLRQNADIREVSEQCAHRTHQYTSWEGRVIVCKPPLARFGTGQPTQLSANRRPPLQKVGRHSSHSLTGEFSLKLVTKRDLGQQPFYTLASIRFLDQREGGEFDKYLIRTPEGKSVRKTRILPQTNAVYLLLVFRYTFEVVPKRLTAVDFTGFSAKLAKT